MKSLKKTASFEDQTGTPDKDEMTHFAGLCSKFNDLHEQMQMKIEELKKLKKEYDALRMETIPAYAEEIGIDGNVTLKNIGSIEIADELTAKISDKTQNEALNYIRAVGSGSIIKRQLVISFDASKEDDALYGEAREVLHGNGISFEEKGGVHWQRLRSFVKERIEAADPDFDRKMFGVWEKKNTIINKRKPHKIKFE
jgi:hypothetical protein